MGGGRSWRVELRCFTLIELLDTAASRARDAVMEVMQQRLVS